MSDGNRAAKVVVAVYAALAALVGVIIYLSRIKIISIELAILMLVALVGICLGLGILIAVYRFVGKLK